jgi:hypothetical protein
MLEKKVIPGMLSEEGIANSFDVEETVEIPFNFLNNWSKKKRR